MRFFTDLRIKIRNFFKKHKKKIYIGIIIFVIVFVINRYIGSIEKVPVRKTTYEPHVSVMDSTSKVPKKLQQPIVEILDKYIQYCNNKEYENAYELLSEDCKKGAYPDIKDFKTYINDIFPNKKLYSIQDYSNINGMYIYQIKIFDDFLATGLTDSEYKYYDEKITIVQEKNDELKLLVGKFLEKTDIKSIAEDDYLKIDIKTKTTTYNTETYHVKITNRSEYTAVLSDGNVGFEEIAINLGAEYRNRNDADLQNVILKSGEAKEYDFTFTKFYDDGDTTQEIVFNAIRIMDNYTGSEETAQEEIDNAITKYSLRIKL